MARFISFTAFVAAALLAAIATARPALDTHAVHEKRSGGVHSRWTNPLRIRSDSSVHVKVGLKQSNLHHGHDFLMDVSHPESENYGKFWTEEDVVRTFAPSDDSVTMVKDWLVTSGIHDSRITHSGNKAWLAFIASGDELEHLLHADFYEYEDSHTGDKTVTCEEYHVPKHLREHIDYITPGIRFPFLRKRSQSNTLKPVFSDHKKGSAINVTSCADLLTPDCISEMYQIPPPSGTPSPNNSLGIFEEGDTYSPSDLNDYFTTFAPRVPNGTFPIFDSIDGGADPGTFVTGESNLDFSLAISLIYPQNTTLYQTDDSYYGITYGFADHGLFNTFLDAIDGSYCTSCYAGECGDSSIDPVYPDAAGYQGQLMCGNYTPTNVISISYGEGEDKVPVSYYERQCNEFMKLGLRGISVFIASGDSGVSAASEGCLGNSTLEIFNADWPASCPYVTSVGASALLANGSITSPEVVANEPVNQYYSASWSSGGGFSNVFGIPEYQADAVANYLANYTPPYPSYNGSILGENGGIYNSSGRGYPDVAAIGNNIPIYVDGTMSYTGGTSAAAPIMASVVNRIIEERIAAGKSGPVGFLNPTFYKNPHAFTDITSGNNPGCDTDGFSAAPGWDPASGLGTPVYPKLRDVLMAL